MCYPGASTRDGATGGLQGAVREEGTGSMKKISSLQEFIPSLVEEAAGAGGWKLDFMAVVEKTSAGVIVLLQRLTVETGAGG